MKLTRHDLARAAWLMTGAGPSGFAGWWATRARASTSARYCCPPLILAIAAWNGARGRDSLATMPPDDGAAFEHWYYGLTFELTDEDNAAHLFN